ncbi:MAG: hypothetical protein ABL953_04750 [Ilumatobacteraceae bacterium]
MRDVIFIAIAMGFFALCIAYTALCDRIIGPDPADSSSEDAAVTT